MNPAPARLKVLSVVGTGRSGTTLLAGILGEVDGFTSAGELRWLWRRGVGEKRPCGCGRVPEECPVWSPVILRTLQVHGRDRDDRQGLERILGAQDELNRAANRWRAIRSARGGPTDWEALAVVRDVTGVALKTLAETTGARVVVDTSKRPHDAAIIAAMPDVDHYVLHVVRDPRAVVHSWRRQKTFSAAGQTRTMGTRRMPATVRRWVVSSLGTELLRREVPPSRWLGLRYEDFAASPRTAIEDVLRLLGEDAPAPFRDDRTALLEPNHLVAGNPTRFTVGAVRIKADEEWRDRMPRHEQLLVATATLPLMRRYGYRRGR